MECGDHVGLVEGKQQIGANIRSVQTVVYLSQAQTCEVNSAGNESPKSHLKYVLSNAQNMIWPSITCDEVNHTFCKQDL